MGVRRQEWQNPFGVIHSQGNLFVSIEEKPIVSQYINAGVYILSSSMLDLVQEDVYCDMTELFTSALKSSKHLHVYPLHEDWADIGQLDDYYKLA
jgi:NDP-sugar pyrophosphorylase family protein